MIIITSRPNHASCASLTSYKRGALTLVYWQPLPRVDPGLPHLAVLQSASLLRSFRCRATAERPRPGPGLPCLAILSALLLYAFFSLPLLLQSGLRLVELTVGDDVHRPWVTNCGLASIGLLTTLRCLSLHDCCSVTKNGLVALSGLGALTSLSLKGACGALLRCREWNTGSNTTTELCLWRRTLTSTRACLGDSLWSLPCQRRCLPLRRSCVAA